MHEPLTVLPLGGAHPDLARVRRLYERAFPANERRPFEALLSGFQGQSELLAFYHEGGFAGFVSLLSCADITHILYFAVEEPLRNQGLGSAALDAVKRLKPGRRLIADLEAPLPDAPNRAQRLRRRTFYRRAGFVPSGVSYRWQGETYELMVFGGALDEAAFLAFWRHFGVTPKTGGSF